MTLPRKRAKPRTFKTPRCGRLRCNLRAEIAGLCVSHAMHTADERFQTGVRERDGRCTGVGILPGECKGVLNAAHVVGRNEYAVRYDPENCHALCQGHHVMVDQHGREHFKYEWATSVLGVEGYQRLMVRARAGSKRREAIEAALLG